MNILNNIKGIYSSLTVYFWIVSYALLLIVSADFSVIKLTENIWWEKFYNLSVNFLLGVLVSFIFYFLVVVVPSNKRNIVIKNNFRKSFKFLKRSIIKDVISASCNGGTFDLRIDSTTVEKLMTTAGFEETFSKTPEGRQRFYNFRNYISDPVLEYRDIVISLQMISKEINFLLYNTEVGDSEVFDFLKSLEKHINRVVSIGTGYDEEKELSDLIWDLYAQFCYLQGDLGYNRIQRYIDKI